MGSECMAKEWTANQIHSVAYGHARPGRMRPEQHSGALYKLNLLIACWPRMAEFLGQ